MNLCKCRECGKVFPEEEIKEYHEDCSPANESTSDTRWIYIYKGSPCCGANYDDYEEEEEEEEE